MIQKFILFFAITALAIAASACAFFPRRAATATRQDWQEEFNIASRTLTDTGESKYVVLQPGFQLVLASATTKLTITVLNETREINGITTRVVEEREEENGALVEVSRNLFAMDQETGDLFYFGEEVDIYERGSIVSHSGAWLAYTNGNRPGLMMPGNPVVGMKYYQEVAPGVAMDRAEIISMTETCRVPAGEFRNCLVSEESTPLEPGVIEHKRHAPGIGLVQDQSLTLVSYGYIDLGGR